MSDKYLEYDVVIIGAGAAGLMCAIESAKRGKSTLLIDHANKIGKKILMSGGGRCNFTNYNIEPGRYLSSNQHFMKSALKRYTQWDFIALVEEYSLKYHEKTLGQLFCDNKSKDIVEILLSEVNKYNAKVYLNTEVESIYKKGDLFYLKTNKYNYQAKSLVIATGGLSIPTMGATGFGYKIAKQFGHKVLPQRAGLVPFIFNEHDNKKYSSLKGISIPVEVSNQLISFSENILFTHKGLSGPAILQISSYWNNGDGVNINLLPSIDIYDYINKYRDEKYKGILKNILNKLFPKSFVNIHYDEATLSKNLGELSKSDMEYLHTQTHSWSVRPKTTEGYRTAEVTLGGVDPNEISSKTMMSSKVDNLYFIGEVVDVTGWLGGYNFQWAWSSGWAAGNHCI